MELGNFSIDWKDFEALATKRFKDLVGKPELSDVTLVSGDGQEIPGHFLQELVMGFYHCQYCERHIRDAAI